ncbi:heat shock protein, mitochondrial [Portunus trituberculatus]|uniref:Heat shock protein, mitochondrial n=1 Tax=Portunus trituberculatus TaxID=210409 RepID=A0A5B7E8Z0_PORTR|nr:heat shock protein, mitochondrial [Portunus trituberculatus]
MRVAPRAMCLLFNLDQQTTSSTGTLLDLAPTAVPHPCHTTPHLNTLRRNDTPEGYKNHSNSFPPQSGSVVAPAVSVGDEVLLPEFGGTKVTLEEKDYFLFRDSDILAKMKSE